MLSTLSLSKAAARAGLIALLLLTPFLPGIAADDDGYLREIEEEARRQAALMTAMPTPTPLTADAGSSEAGTERLAAGLDQKTFEQALHEALPGTYALYQQFEPPRKQQVYEAYRQDNRLTGVSETVIQLLTAKP